MAKQKSARVYLKKIDAFGHPVMVNYRGRQKYKTGCGGVVTLVSTMVMTAYLTFLMVGFYTNQDVVIMQYTKTRPPGAEVALNLTDVGFEFCAAVYDEQDVSVGVPPSIGKLRFYYLDEDFGAH